MKPVASRRAQALTRSEIRIMTTLCDEIGGINLSQGICDLPLPPHLAEYAKAAIDHGTNHYSAYDGLFELKDAIARKLRNYNHIDVDAKTELVVSSGSTGAFYSACFALLNPGDEVLLFEPYYGYHEYTLLSLDLVPVYTKLIPGDWELDLADMEGKITSRTRGVVVNTPANPSGKVFSKEELQQLSQLCIRYDLIIFTDEIYEYMVYDGLSHISPGSLPELKDRVITISGFSKTFSITGWRIGYSASRQELAQPIGCASDLIYVCAPSPLQQGVAQALMALPDAYYEDLCIQYQRKRDLMCDALQDASLLPYVPQGAYYILVDVSTVPGHTAKEKALYILDKTGIAAVPGSAFYHDDCGENLIRLCFAKKDSVLVEACERLQKLKP